MTSLINFVVFKLEKNYEKKVKAFEALKYTSFVDLALAIIFSLGALLVSSINLPLGIALGTFGVVFLLTGQTFLNLRNSIEKKDLRFW